jgi:hypothetical protein
LIKWAKNGRSKVFSSSSLQSQIFRMLLLLLAAALFCFDFYQMQFLAFMDDNIISLKKI